MNSVLHYLFMFLLIFSACQRPDETSYSWIESDTTFSLLKQDTIVWQFNYNTVYGKPFFHPIVLDGKTITCLSPDDHIWHLGQWFSWKFINGDNYWEYIKDTYSAEGTTEVISAGFNQNPDYSAEIILNIAYISMGGEVVLKEVRRILISPPLDRNLRMDYDMTFEAVADQVILDRTPIEGEPEGKSWGGYSGMSIRFNQDFTESGWISEFGENAEIHGRSSDWLYMGFKGSDGKAIGSAMFLAKDSRREKAAWYLTDDKETPFYYFSPAYLFYESLTFKKGESLRLKYRILHMSGTVTDEILESAYKEYLDSENQ